MKRILLTIALLAGLSANAAVVSTNNLVATNGVANLIDSSALINYVILSSTATNAGSVSFYDTTNVGLTNVIAAYVTKTTYSTNAYVTTWTNYYGATNTITNKMIFSQLVTNAATTNTLTPIWTFTLGTNATVEVENLATTFQRGVTVKNNNSIGTVNVMVGYTQ